MTFNEYLTNKYIEEEQIIDDIIPDEFDKGFAVHDAQSKLN